MRVPTELTGCVAAYMLWRSSVPSDRNKSVLKVHNISGNVRVVAEAIVMAVSATVLITLGKNPQNKRVFATRTVIVLIVASAVGLWRSFIQKQREGSENSLDLEPTNLKRAARMVGALAVTYLATQKSHPITAIFGFYLVSHEIFKHEEAKIFSDKILDWIRPPEVMKITHVFAAFAGLSFLSREDK
ncbi:hypothetical protein K0U07_04085 [bacterium]|nr:hypothetical protein [bacterium]